MNGGDEDSRWGVTQFEMEGMKTPEQNFAM